jgi:Sigma-54 interaction domain
MSRSRDCTQRTCPASSAIIGIRACVAHARGVSPSDLLRLKFTDQSSDVHLTRAVDLRVITGSSRSLFERVLTREFREDLFYRLNVIHIRASR